MSPPIGVWIGVLLMTGSIVLPFAITYSDPEDLFEDGLEWGLVLTWPVFVLGALVVGVSVLVAAF